MLSIVLSALIALVTAETPIQWQIFALRHPYELHTGKASGSLKTLSSINAEVNSKITPITEIGDTWSLWPKAGDCEDYAITKRHELLKLGINSQLVITTAPDGQFHMVLLSGGYVLDNLRKAIIKQSRSGYRFILVQSPDSANRWLKPKDQP